MKFNTKPITEKYYNQVFITAKVDPNDADYVVKNSKMSEDDFDELFETFIKLGNIVGVRHGLKNLFEQLKYDDDDVKYAFSNILYTFLPTTEYSDYGNNLFGHTIVELIVTYYDSTGNSFEVDISKPIENV